MNREDDDENYSLTPGHRKSHPQQDSDLGLVHCEARASTSCPWPLAIYLNQFYVSENLVIQKIFSIFLNFQKRHIISIASFVLKEKQGEFL